MTLKVINFADKLDFIKPHWTPKIIAQMNNYHFKLVKVQGEFVWHDHPETDEVFIVLKGSLEIAMRDKTVSLAEGEMIVIPKGVEHKPISEEECHILLVEPEGTVNTGNAGGEFEAPNDNWI